jgi:hypothetical protein
MRLTLAARYSSVGDSDFQWAHTDLNISTASFFVIGKLLPQKEFLTWLYVDGISYCNVISISS